MTDGQPTPDEAAQALDQLRDQRLKLMAVDVLPPWLLPVAGGVGAATAAGVGLAKDLLDRRTADIASLAGLGVLLAILAVLALTSRGVAARRLGFRARPAATLGERSKTSMKVVAIFFPGIVIYSFVLPALHLPFPHTFVMMFWVAYAVATVAVLREMQRRATRGSKR